MKKSGIGSHTRAFEGHTNDWITPKHIMDSLGIFDLDPCSSVNQPWETAKAKYTVEDDGLSKNWFGTVWLNPPYGPHTKDWLQKLSEHNDGISLIFARTETKMFFDWVWDKATSVLFLEGRLYFYTPEGQRGKSNAGGPSVLIAYGEKASDRLENSGIKGKFIRIK